MKQSIKISLFLVFTTLNANLIFAQSTDALIITPQGNVNVVSGKVQEGGNDLLPKGAIIMWYGDKVPPGWAICDGSLYVKESGKTEYIRIEKTNEGKYINEPDKIRTPDLVDRFVIGAGGEYPDAKSNRSGGQKFVTLTEDNLPSHSHKVDLKTNLAGNHRHDQTYVSYSQSSGSDVAFPMYYKYSYWPPQSATSTIPTDYSGDHEHKVNGDTAKTGNGKEFDNRPPFYALYYIMKL
jgi:microcystin-dependent protein